MRFSCQCCKGPGWLPHECCVKISTFTFFCPYSHSHHSSSWISNKRFLSFFTFLLHMPQRGDNLSHSELCLMQSNKSNSCNRYWILSSVWGHKFCQLLWKLNSCSLRQNLCFVICCTRSKITHRFYCKIDVYIASYINTHSHGYALVLYQMSALVWPCRAQLMQQKC